MAKSTLYVITNLSMPNLCKVGITDDLDKRLRSLNSGSSVPTRFQLYESFEIKNAEILEQETLKHFADKRLNKKREFIEEHPEKVCNFIRENKKKARVEKVTKSKFSKAGIPIGAKLFFIDGDVYKDIQATVLENGKIEYKGKETSLSAAAQQVLKKRFDKNWKAVQGTIYWSYKGKAVREYFDNI